MEWFKAELLSKEIISMYDYDFTRLNIQMYFDNYREALLKKRLMAFSINDPLGNDNMGIFSSKITNTVQNKMEQLEKLNKHIDYVNKGLEMLKNELTDDEEIILQKSIIENATDEDLAKALSVVPRAIYYKKKSCYIKTAIFFNLEVLKK